MNSRVREYYLCKSCNLSFKTLKVAIDHKIMTNHTILKEFFPQRHYNSFPPFELKITSPDMQQTSFNTFSQIGECQECDTKIEHYVCLTCGLEFKEHVQAEEHRINSKHHIVKTIHPIGSIAPQTFKKLRDIIGSDVDYESFNQRMEEETPEED